MHSGEEFSLDMLDGQKIEKVQEAEFLGSLVDS